MGRHLTPKAVSVDWADMKKCTLVQFIVIEEAHKIVTDTKAFLAFIPTIGFRFSNQTPILN
jgi:hypothetical protein